MTSSSLSQLDDYALIQRYLKHQDAQCFSELYDRYADKVYSKCLNLLKKPGAAEDATQEIFMKIFLRISSFNNQSRFSTWIYSVTYNYCIDILRKEQRFQWFSTEETPGLEIADGQDTSDAEFLELDLQRLAKIMHEIPEDERNLLIMKYQDGLSIKQLCQIFQKNESAIKMRLKRAKDRLRLRYEQIFLFALILTVCLKK